MTLLFVGAVATDAGAFRSYEAERQGPYVGLGLGGGIIGMTAGDEAGQGIIDELGTSGGLNVNFRVGFALSDYVTVGIETSGWAKKYDLPDDSELSVNIFFTGIAGTIYPNNIGFYARGALGLSTVSGVLKVPGEPDQEPDPAYGFGGLVAAGYEWRATRRLALGPQVDAAFLQPDGILVKSAWFVSFTVQANFYFN